MWEWPALTHQSCPIHNSFTLTADPESVRNRLQTRHFQRSALGQRDITTHRVSLGKTLKHEIWTLSSVLSIWTNIDSCDVLCFVPQGHVCPAHTLAVRSVRFRLLLTHLSLHESCENVATVLNIFSATSGTTCKWHKH